MTKRDIHVSKVPYYEPADGPQDNLEAMMSKPKMTFTDEHKAKARDLWQELLTMPSEEISENAYAESKIAQALAEAEAPLKQEVKELAQEALQTKMEVDSMVAERDARLGVLEAQLKDLASGAWKARIEARVRELETELARAQETIRSFGRLAMKPTNEADRKPTL